MVVFVVYSVVLGPDGPRTHAKLFESAEIAVPRLALTHLGFRTVEQDRPISAEDAIAWLEKGGAVYSKSDIARYPTFHHIMRLEVADSPHLADQETEAS
jgi:hypothetical protein